MRSLPPIRPSSFTSRGSLWGNNNSNHEKSPTLPKSKESHLKTPTHKKNTWNMAHDYIIHWNCRSLSSNREDIEWLISKYSPVAICLQETMIKPEYTSTYKHYSAYCKCNIQGHGVVCILVKIASSIVKLIFKLICRPWLFVLPSIIKHIL